MRALQVFGRFDLGPYVLVCCSQRVGTNACKELRVLLGCSARTQRPLSRCGVSKRISFDASVCVCRCTEAINFVYICHVTSIYLNLHGLSNRRLRKSFSFIFISEKLVNQSISFFHSSVNSLDSSIFCQTSAALAASNEMQSSPLVT